LTICLCHILADPSEEVKPTISMILCQTQAEMPVQTVSGRNHASSIQSIHGNYHGHWYPFDYVTEQFTWDNTYCPQCRWVLASTLNFVNLIDTERIQILVHWNHLITNRVISEYRIPRDNADDEDEHEDDEA